MSDKKKMPADGDGVAKGKPDGVSAPPATEEVDRVQGRSSGGESGGGAYPNPHSGGRPSPSGLSGEKPEKAYYGGDNPNATTRPRKAPDQDRPGDDPPPL